MHNWAYLGTGSLWVESWRPGCRRWAVSFGGEVGVAGSAAPQKAGSLTETSGLYVAESGITFSYFLLFMKGSDKI